MAKPDGKIRTKMADALFAAFEERAAKDGRTGRVGKRILTNRASDVGVKFDPAKKKKHAADSAVEEKMAA